MSNHLLLDLDSKIPNLALMKVSAWAKAKGDHVDLKYPTIKPDEVWVSCIFTWNREQALGVGKFYEQSAKVHYGGTGFDWGLGDGLDFSQRINLPPEIEFQRPDYQLYDDDRAVGFCLRGCNRTCGFCDVWRKEGKIRAEMYSPISEWVPESMNKVLLLDNDISLQGDEFHDRTIKDCRDSGRKLSITQGYDIRCVTEERSKLLAENKPYDLKFKRHCLYFAWDKMSSEGAVRRGVPILKDAGFRGAELFCYMVVGYDTTFEQDYYRYKVLWEEFGVYPFVMIFNNRRDNPQLRAFARWVNRRVHKTATWDEYRGNPDYNEVDYDVQEQLELA